MKDDVKQSAGEAEMMVASITFAVCRYQNFHFHLLLCKSWPKTIPSSEKSCNKDQKGWLGGSAVFFFLCRGKGANL